MKARVSVEGFVASLVVLASACSAVTPRVAEPERSRAEAYADRGQAAFDAGDHEAGLRLATRALVVRLAACGYECPDSAYSFIQLGDMRRALGQRAWAEQCYRRALEVLGPHDKTHADWISAVRRRVDAP